VSGTRLPCVRAWHTKDYVQQFNAKIDRLRKNKGIDKNGRRVAIADKLVFRSQADLAADLIDAVRVPTDARVLVLGDTAFEAKVVRAACQRRGFDWIVPANPERVLADTPEEAAQRKVRRKYKQPQTLRKRLCDYAKQDQAKENRPTLIELCPGEGAWAKHQNASPSKTGRKKYARRYWACAETLDIHNVGKVRVVFSSTKETKEGSRLETQKILLSNRVDLNAKEIVEAYAVRWQIELFFKEMKSELGLSSYRMRDFGQIKAWVQVCCITFVYLQWYRQKKIKEEERNKKWWQEQRSKGLKRQVQRDIESEDLKNLCEMMQQSDAAEQLAQILQRLHQAAPTEQRRPA
jgi:hypothetical protein